MPRFEPLEGEIILTDRTVQQMDDLIRRATEADRALSGVQGKLAALNAGLGATAAPSNFDQYERLGKALDAIDVNKLDAIRQAMGQIAQTPAGLDAGPVESLARLLDAASESALRHAQAAAQATAAQKALNDEMARAQGGGATFAPQQRMLLNESDSPYALPEGATEPIKPPDPVAVSQSAAAIASLMTAENQQAESARKAADAQRTLNQEIERTAQIDTTPFALTDAQREDEPLEQYYARAEAAAGRAPEDWQPYTPAVDAAAIAQQAAQAAIPAVEQAATQSASAAAAKAATEAAASTATPAVTEAAIAAATEASSAAAAEQATPAVLRAAQTAAPAPGAPAAPPSLASMGQPGAAPQANSVTDMLMALVKGMSVGALELSKQNQFVQQNPVVSAGFNTMQAGQTVGALAPLFGGGAGGVAALGGIISSAGTATAAVGALVGVFNQFNDSLADAERRSLAIDKLKEKFGDVNEVVEQTQAAINGVASENEIENVMGSISKTSVLTDLDNFVQLSEVAQRKAYQMGVSWKEAMDAISEGVQSGNGQALQELGLVENPTRTLLEYAESVGKLVPQLSEWEIQQALLNEALETGSQLIATPMSDSERLIAAYDTLESSVNDATTAFTNWLVSLVSPDAQSAVGWWADQMERLGGSFNRATEAAQKGANENKARGIAQESGQGDAYGLLLNQRSGAEGALTGELMGRGLMGITGQKTMSDEEILAQNPDLQGLYEAQAAADAAVNRATQTLLAGGNIADDPAVKLAAARQELERINQQIDQMSTKTPEMVTKAAEGQLDAAQALLDSLQAADPYARNPNGRVGSDTDIAAAQRKVAEATLATSIAGQTDQSDIQTQVDALVSERTQIEQSIAELERLAMTPAERLAEDKRRLEEILAEIEATQQRIAENSHKLTYMPEGAGVQGQIDADQRKVGNLELERHKLMSQPEVAASLRADEAMQETGNYDLYQRLQAAAAAAAANGQQSQKIVGAGGQNVDQIAQELASSSEALKSADQGMFDAAGGSQEDKQAALNALELAEARHKSAVAAATLADATLKLKEAQDAVDPAARREAEAALQAAQAQMQGAEAAEKAVFSKVNIAEASAQVAEAERLYNAALAGGVPAIVASAEANLRAATSKYANAAASQGLVATETSVVSIAGQMFDAVSGLPVAFDAAAQGKDGLIVALLDIKMAMQDIIMQAGQMSMSIGYSLMPYIGVDAGLAKGREYAGQMQGLVDIVQPKVDSGELDPGAAQQILAGGAAIQRQEAAQMMNSTGGAASSAEKNVNALNKALEGLARAEFKDSTKGLIDLDSMLGREDEIDEKARRMADVAVKGFESPWFDGLKDMFPADVLEKGADAVKGYAAQMVRDHQQGLTNIFYDTEMAADNVIDKINAKVNQDKLVAEVRDKVKEKLGGEGAAVSDEDIMKALGIDTSEQAVTGAVKQMTMTLEEYAKSIQEALGDGETGGTAVNMTEMQDDDKGKIEENAQKVADVVGPAYVAQIENGKYGQQAITKVTADIEAKKDSLKEAGANAGKWWGDAFKDHIEKNLPPGLLDILVVKLLPLMQQAQAEEGERNGTGAGATPV